MRRLLYLGLFVLYLAHNDWWLWEDAGLLLGLPVGLTYHLLYCFVVIGAMALLVRFAWPARFSAAESGGAGAPRSEGESDGGGSS
jgi:hypothetical protein